MMHQLMLVFLMIVFSLAYSQVEPDDLQASRLIGKSVSYQLLFYRVLRKLNFRLDVLLCRRVLFRESAHKT